MSEKKTPAIRFKGFADDWEQHTVEKLTGTTYGGGTPEIDNENFWNGDIPWIQSSNTMENQLFSVNIKRYISKDGLSHSAAQLVPKNSIAVVTHVGVGKMTFMPYSYATSQDFISLSELKCNPQFLCHVLYKKLQEDLYLVQGSAIKGITKDDLMHKQVYIPECNEQNNIATMMKDWEGIIAVYQRKLTKLQLLKKSMLTKMFPKDGARVPEIRFQGFHDDWVQHQFGDVGSVAMCKRVFKDETSDKGDIPFFKIGTFGGNPDAYISRELFDEYKSKYPYPEIGDILLSASGTIGRQVEYKGEDAYYQDSNIIWLKHGKILSNKFLKVVYQVIKWNGVEGSTIQRLYNDNILKTRFFLPSLEEQEAIGDYFYNLDNLISLQKDRFAKLQQIKQSMLSKLFV